MARTSKKILPDYTEDTVATSIDTFLAIASFPFSRYSVEFIARRRERWLGADAILSKLGRGFRPLFLQFKRPYGYPDHSRSAIIKDRNMLTPALSVSPRTLYFELLNKKPKHHDFQHNVLFRLRRRLLRWELGEAVYVCPLFLNRSAYRSNLHLSALRRWLVPCTNPVQFDSLEVHSADQIPSLFDSIPVFAEHITVPPHELIDEPGHRYSFTETGDEVCFHSPTSLPGLGQPLASVLVEQYRSLYRAPEIGGDTMTKLIKELLKDFEVEDSSRIRTSLGQGLWLEAWMEFGALLESNYSIHLCAIYEESSKRGS